MKTVLLLSVCAVSLTLSSGRAPSETSRRRSSQQEDVLTSLAAIKAATAKIEQCLAADEASETASLSSMNSNASSAPSDPAASEPSGDVGSRQEELNALINAVYTKAIAGIRAATPTLQKDNMSEMIRLGQQIQLALNPAQVIANELAPQFLQISNSAEVTRLRNMISAAAQASEVLIKKYDKYFKSKIYKQHVDQLKEIRGELEEASSKIMEGVIYDKEKSKEAGEGTYYMSVVGQSLINNFSKEYVKLGLMRQYAVNDDGSLMVLDAQNAVAAESPEGDVVRSTLEILTKLSTGQFDLTFSGVVIDHMTLLKSGVNLASISHKYYAVSGLKVFETELKDGRYSFNKKAHPVHMLTEQESAALTSTVTTKLKTALERCKFKSPKFGPIRMILKAKMDLTVADDAQEASTASE